LKTSVSEVASQRTGGPHVLQFPHRHSAECCAPPRSADSALEGRQAQFPSRALIFQEGDPANSFFQTGEGMVMLYRLLPDGRRQVVEFLQPGDVFGISGGPVHDCTAETLIPTACAVLDRSEVGHSAALAQRLNAALFAQLCRLHEHVMLLGRKSATERMASFLMHFIPGRGRGRCPGPPQGDDRARIPLPMTRLEIADYLGLTIETVSRVLTRFMGRRVLSAKAIDEVCVADVCQLCRLSGTHLVSGRWCTSRANIRSRASIPE
jgi:CRP/FNR family transcriptional regulator, nitrogen fixation regulation protein